MSKLVDENKKIDDYFIMQKSICDKSFFQKKVYFL